MLVYDGNVIKENLTEEAAREHGVKAIDEVDLAELKVDGKISILFNNF